jgi:hypothetical protein
MIGSESVGVCGAGCVDCGAGGSREAEADAAADWLRTNDAGNVYVDSRTVGPWERAEVKQIEGEK